MKSKVIISLFETVRLSVSISLRNLYNSLNSIKKTRLSISEATAVCQSVKIGKIQNNNLLNNVEHMIQLVFQMGGLIIGNISLSSL